MPSRLWHKLSRLIDFPRRVLIELEEIRRAQTRLNDDLEGLKNHLKNALDETRRDLKEETAKAQANLDETVKNWTALATSRFENFFRLSIQNQDSSNELVAGIKRRMDDYAGATEAAIKELQDTVRSYHTNNRRDPPIAGRNGSDEKS